MQQDSIIFNFFTAPSELFRALLLSLVVMNFGITERLKSMENHLKISPSSSEDVFERIKRLENRILYLESISPEYLHFLEKTTQPKSGDSRETGTRKRKYSIRSIDEFINELEEIYL
uniref:Uncharacterized protein n=1 Tax=Lutzomyia longipalpis TaxID=7200 RepID=A0A1B0CXZ6_LUTLO